VLIDRNGLEVLDEAECLRLLATTSMGRVAITSGSLPVILPVNYLVVDRTVYFRTGRGSKLDAATTNAVVAFEVDDFDLLSHTGWSVNVIGVARDLGTSPGGLAVDTSHIPRWAPGDEDRVVAVQAEMVSGRRLRHDLPQASGTRQRRSAPAG
jgi:hypothetical protein